MKNLVHPIKFLLIVITTHFFFCTNLRLINKEKGGIVITISIAKFDQNETILQCPFLNTQHTRQNYMSPGGQL